MQQSILKANPVHIVRIKDIKPASWNPPGRIQPHRLVNLRKSIEDIGLLYPVLIDEQCNLIDGHRRLAVAKLLEWDSIQAITISSEFEHSYGSVQMNQEKLTGNELLGVYISNPRALVSSQLRKASRIEEVCGKKAVEMLYKSGLTAGTFDLAMRIVRFLEATIEPIVVLRWLVKQGMGATIRHLLDAGVSAQSMKRAITEDRPMRIKISAD